MGLAGLLRLSFEEAAVQLDALLLSVTPQLFIAFYSQEEIVTALGGLHVLDAYVDTLGEDSVSDLLVDDDSNSVWGHVEDTPSSAVVGLVWHTLLEGTATLDVDVVSSLVDMEESGKWLNTLLAEVTREHVPRTATVTRCVCLHHDAVSGEMAD